MNYVVYILISISTNRYYVGCTKDLCVRLQKHNFGYVKSTKAYRPWKVLHTESYDSLSRAREREKQIKSWKSRKSIEDLMSRKSKTLAPSSNG